VRCYEVLWVHEKYYFDLYGTQIQVYMPRHRGESIPETVHLRLLFFNLTVLEVCLPSDVCFSRMRAFFVGILPLSALETPMLQGLCTHVTPLDTQLFSGTKEKRGWFLVT
jgi:hypothetical protein